MKKKILFGMGIIWMAAFVLLFAVSYEKKTLDLNYIEQIHFQNGFLYSVDRGEDNYFRIIRSDPEGMQGDVITCSRYEKAKYRMIRQLFFDEQGGAYVMIDENEVKSFQGISSKVFYCNFEKGRLEETGYDFTEVCSRNHEVDIQGIRKKKVYYFDIPGSETTQSEVKVCTMDSESQIRYEDAVSLEYPCLKSQFFLSKNGILLWMDYEGKVSAKVCGTGSYLQIEGITEGENTFKSLSDDNENTAFVLDYRLDCIREIDLTDQTEHVVCSGNEIRKQNPDFAFQNLRNPEGIKTGFCSGINGEDPGSAASVCIYEDGIYRNVEEITLTAGALCRRMWKGYTGIFIAAVLLCIYWYVYCRYQVQTILVRLILVFILGLFMADRVLEQWIEETIREQLERNQIMALSVLGEQLKEHIVTGIEKDPNTFPSGEKNLILNRTVGEKTEETEKSREQAIYVYSILKADEEGNLFVCESMSEYSTVPVEWCYTAESVEALYHAYTSLEYVNLSGENESGKQNDRFIPLVLGDKTVYGILSVSAAGNVLDYQIWYYQWNMRVVSVALLSVLSLILILILIFFLRPLKALKGSAGKLAAGEMGVTVPVHGHDEIADISRAFNQMSLGIAQYVQDMQDMSDGYYKFIPAKILELLGKESIQQLRLGDQVTENMTILSVHALQNPGEQKIWFAENLYGEVNEMLSVLVEPIDVHHGVVEHFENTGLSAFFTENSREALNAAIEIHRSLDQKICGKGRTIAISYGQVMIGVIGHEKRMEAAVLSVHSNLAKELCRRGEIYGARILITHLIYQQIPDFEKQYHARYLGNVYLRASDTLERIYDVYDGDAEEDFYYKELTRPQFEKGVELYIAKKFYQARLLFVEVLKQYRKDRAAREYLYRCDRYYKSADAEDVDTVIETF